MSQVKTYYQQVVIVGGGAGGLELATRMARCYGSKGLNITLVDAQQTHIWKPLLHEVATGRLDPGIDEVSYTAQARQAGFQFQIGRMDSLDRTRKCIGLAPVLDNEGNELLPARSLYYDYLILAVGSVCNDFGTPGVKEHAYFLDSRRQADLFHQGLLSACLKQGQNAARNLKISIVGGGATGVELAAELFNTAEQLAHYGLGRMDGKRIKVTLVEAGPSLLPALPVHVSDTVRDELHKLGVVLREGTRVKSVQENALITTDDERIEADLIVWSAGVRAPDFLAGLDGLETNKINQLIVGGDLRTTVDGNIFAIGDCAACLQPDTRRQVPPRAQAAHQMARYLLKNFPRILRNEPVKPFHYRDRGSLVSLSHYSAVGNLMGNLARGNFTIEGRIARFVYASLYRTHQLALFGISKTLLMILVDRINRVIRPRLKLH